MNSTIALWTACFVLLTLVVNAPLVSPMMRLLRLDRIPLEQRKTRARARRALLRFTDAALGSLRDDDDELLQGEGAPEGKAGGGGGLW